MPMSCCAFFHRDINVVMDDLTEGAKKVLDFFKDFVTATKTFVEVTDAFVDSKALKKATKALDEASKILLQSSAGVNFLNKFTIPTSAEGYKKFLDRNNDGVIFDKEDAILLFQEIEKECENLIAQGVDAKFVNQFKSKFTDAINALKNPTDASMRNVSASLNSGLSLS